MSKRLNWLIYIVVLLLQKCFPLNDIADCVSGVLVGYTIGRFSCKGVGRQAQTLKVARLRKLLF